jgi:SAM-dependent methyltransferase
VKRPEMIARQSARPSGALGWLLGRIMALETAEANRLALDLLELRRTDHVLEIGFGHGATIERLSRIVDDGAVAGIDVSETMVRLATRRSRADIARGRVRLCLGSAEQLPYPDDHFDRILSVHTLYFWPQPQRAFAEIRRVLRPSGRFVLAWRDDPESRRTFPASVYRFQDEEAVTGMLREADLVLTKLSRHERGDAVLHLAVARKGGAITGLPPSA